MLPCHHAICDTCVIIFGLPSKTAEYHFDISQCPVCNQPLQVSIRQLPPTKLPVVLSLDGGGIRGIIQLGLLKSLEKKLGNEIALPQIFDLCTGTSVGMCYILFPNPTHFIKALVAYSLGFRGIERHGYGLQ